MASRTVDYRTVLRDAINEFATHGYDSQDRLDYWLGRLREAIEADAPSPSGVYRKVRAGLEAIYDRLRGGGYRRFHPGLRQFVIDRVGRDLARTLERRALVSVDLIVLNRKKSIEQTLQRFAGLATSIPPGGTKTLDKREAVKTISKSIRQMTFEERRVVIDQGHKMTANINQTLAEDGGAIAAKWNSHWRQAGYDYREDHKERDQRVYLLRGNWAQKAGLVKAGEAGFYDKIDGVAVAPFCRCWIEYVYDLDDMPRDMLTRKGLAAIGA